MTVSPDSTSCPNVSSIEAIVSPSKPEIDHSSSISETASAATKDHTYSDFEWVPTVHLDCVSHFVEQFASDDCLQFATGRNQAGQMAALLPLVRMPAFSYKNKNEKPWFSFGQKENRVWNVLELPNNPWIQTGDLMVDPQLYDAQTLTNLTDSLLQEPPCLLKLDWIYESKYWQELMNALERAGCQVFRQQTFDVGLIDTRGDWESYLAGLSKIHRKGMRRNLRKLEEIGETSLERQSHFASRGALLESLQEAFAIEHRGWKGEQGTSVNSQAGMLEFYTDIAWILAQRNQFELQFLRVGDRRVAFEFGYRAAGTYYSHKVGYEPEFAKYGPGQALMYLQLQEWFANDEIRRVDTIGVLSEATRKWRPTVRPRYRYWVGTRGLPREWVRAIKTWKPRLKQWRSQVAGWFAKSE